uniref:E3 ubiquitin-protein ligase TRAIP n=1 Tax=Oncorhynchus gorbuscha TaxID=8017 RepID=UPI001EAED6C9|nr:E3 ubiquitin-protein ligase TRAIP [Oncorhynchus gorbuscha]XP_046198728.1 E3 ubiquitin-protein ligase TRAIP [Oncorhynchus gorbuscha]XP_046198729.1 E3 ubiquitin-protein ligase TRAIP [Oncorhynchus gorbuscha]
MPIRAYCTICSDFFDHSRDVAAIHCGHTFHYECLLQWFQTAPNKTCPQCRKQVSTRHIINKLFFDIGGEGEGSSADPECLQNELDRMKAVLSTKERDWRDRLKMVEGLKETVDRQKKDLDIVRKEIGKKDMLCSVLRKQMKYLENQQSETQAAKEEARRLRTKMKTYESLDVVLQGQRAEVESMISDMGVGQAAMEELSIYCISLKKEYENLKGSLRYSNEMSEKLKREVFASNNKLQKATMEMNRTNDDMKAVQNDLTNADKEITSLKKKVEILQKTLSTPTRTNEALSRLVFESPAPVQLQQPRLHQPANSEDIDLNMTFDITTPDLVDKRSSQVPSKKMRLDPATLSSSPTKHRDSASFVSKAREEEVPMGTFFRNSILFRKKTFGSMLDPQRSKLGAVRSGYDGLGGRTKFFQPSPLSDIRPLMMKAKRKKVSRPAPAKISTCLTLDSYLE